MAFRAEEADAVETTDMSPLSARLRLDFFELCLAEACASGVLVVFSPLATLTFLAGVSL